MAASPQAIRLLSNMKTSGEINSLILRTSLEPIAQADISLYASHQRGGASLFFFLQLRIARNLKADCRIRQSRQPKGAEPSNRSRRFRIRSLPRRKKSKLDRLFSPPFLFHMPSPRLQQII